MGNLGRRLGTNVQNFARGGCKSDGIVLAKVENTISAIGSRKGPGTEEVEMAYRQVTERRRDEV